MRQDLLRRTQSGEAGSGAGSTYWLTSNDIVFPLFSDLNPPYSGAAEGGIRDTWAVARGVLPHFHFEMLLNLTSALSSK